MDALKRYKISDVLSGVSTQTFQLPFKWKRLDGRAELQEDGRKTRLCKVSVARSV